MISPFSLSLIETKSGVAAKKNKKNSRVIHFEFGQWVSGFVCADHRGRLQ